jgi:hypothetical protein
LINGKIEPSQYQRAILSVPEQYNMLLAGGRGGGKSFAIMFLLLRHVQMYGSAAYALLVRESYEAIKQLEEEFELLVYYVYGTNLKIHNKTEHTFHFPNGGKVQFGQLAEQKDYVKYQGKSYTLLVVDEYGEISNPRWVTLLMSNLRGPKGLPIRTVWAANPGGAQHGFLHYEFIASSEPWVPFERNGATWVCCPSTLTDNPHLDHEQYEQALRDACGNDEDLLKAWLSGDWNIARGAYFAGALDERIHKIPAEAFPIQKLSSVWLPYLAMDWGSGATCITYLAAVSPGVNGIPKGSLVLVDELALHEANDLTKGLAWPPAKLAEAQKSMCNSWGVFPAGAGDDAYGLEDSLLETLEEHGVYFVRPKKERVAGWQEMRNMLTNAKTRNGQPGLWISARCKYFWKTVPFLQRDPKRPEDLITTGPDHGADAARYAVMHRGHGAFSTGTTGTY